MTTKLTIIAAMVWSLSSFQASAADAKLTHLAHLMAEAAVGENAPELTADFTSGTGFGTIPLIFETTTLASIQHLDGGSGHAIEEATDEVTWLCYTRHATHWSQSRRHLDGAPRRAEDYVSAWSPLAALWFGACDGSPNPASMKALRSNTGGQHVDPARSSEAAGFNYWKTTTKAVSPLVPPGDNSCDRGVLPAHAELIVSPSSWGDRP